jgi:arsenical pump membrane protein
LKKDIPKRIDISLLGNHEHSLKNRKLFIYSWFFLIFLLIAYFIGDTLGAPISFFALGGAGIFMIIASKFNAVKPKEIIKNAPWQIVWFSLGLYIVVYGLKNAGLIYYIEMILSYFVKMGDFVSIVGTGFLSAFLSAIMNNMPTVMMMDIALKNVGSDMMVYANIIGCNLGPKMTPFGSLATLLWLHILAKKGIKIGFWQYSKFVLIVTPIVLFVTLLSLV